MLHQYRADPEILQRLHSMVVLLTGVGVPRPPWLLDREAQSCHPGSRSSHLRTVPESFAAEAQLARRYEVYRVMLLCSCRACNDWQHACDSPTLTDACLRLLHCAMKPGPALAEQ